MPPPARSRMNGGGSRSPSDALIIGSGNSFLFPQQIVFISVFHHFAVCLAPDGNMLSSSCGLLSLPSSPSHRSSISLIISGGGGGGRWRKCKCSSVLLPSDRSGCYNCCESAVMQEFLISTQGGHTKLYIEVNI